MRTANSCESYNLRLSRHSYSLHPNIFYFVDESLERQLETKVKLRSTNYKKKSTPDIKPNLREKMTKYTNNVITPLIFVQFISFKFLSSA